MKNALFRFARTPAGGWILRAVLSAFPSWLPVRRLPVGHSLLAFHHPVPSYQVHVLLVPLPPLEGLHNIGTDSGRLLARVLSAACDIAQHLELGDGWQLVVNGGGYQDVAVLHFHLLFDAKTNVKKLQ